MDLLDAIYQRRAVRDYRDEAPETAVITALIDAAIQAPTAMHREPWRFTVVRDIGLLKRWSDAAKAHVLDTMAAIRNCGACAPSSRRPPSTSSIMRRS